MKDEVIYTLVSRVKAGNGPDQLKPRLVERRCEPRGERECVLSLIDDDDQTQSTDPSYWIRFRAPLTKEHHREIKWIAQSENLDRRNLSSICQTASALIAGDSTKCLPRDCDPKHAVDTLMDEILGGDREDHQHLLRAIIVAVRGIYDQLRYCQMNPVHEPNLLMLGEAVRHVETSFAVWSSNKV